MTNWRAKNTATLEQDKDYLELLDGEKRVFRMIREMARDD